MRKDTGDFRIVSNGMRYRVQQRVIHTFLFWKWEKWHELGKFVSPLTFIPSSFNTVEEAKVAKAHSERNYLAEKHGWLPIYPDNVTCSPLNEIKL